MVVFGIDVKGKTLGDDVLAQVFMEKADEKLQDKNFFRNPFLKSHIVRVEKKRYVLCMNPGYPSFHWYGIILTLGLVLIWGWGWWCYPSALFSLTGLIWTKYFFYGSLWLGLRKKSFEGKMRLLGTDELLRLTYGPD